MLLSLDPRLAVLVCPPPLLQIVHARCRASSGRVEVKDSGSPRLVMLFRILAFLGLLAEALVEVSLWEEGSHLEDTSLLRTLCFSTPSPPPGSHPTQSFIKRLEPCVLVSSTMRGFIWPYGGRTRVCVSPVLPSCFYHLIASYTIAVSDKSLTLSVVS